MTMVECPQKQMDRRQPFLSVILVIVLQTNSIFELEPEFDESNPYLNTI